MNDQDVDEAMKALCATTQRVIAAKLISEKWDALVPDAAKAYEAWENAEEKSRDMDYLVAYAKRTGDKWALKFYEDKIKREGIKPAGETPPPELTDEELAWYTITKLFYLELDTFTRVKVLRFLAGKCTFDEVAKTAREEAFTYLSSFPMGLRNRLEPSEDEIRAFAERVVATPTYRSAFIIGEAKAYLAGDTIGHPYARRQLLQSFSYAAIR